MRGTADAPIDLRLRALDLAGELLEFCGHSMSGSGRSEALRLLDSGAAWNKLQAICEAQGGLREPGVARLREPVHAKRTGYVSSIDSRCLARVAKFAGAPTDPTAGLDLHVQMGDFVEFGAPMFTLHAETPGELAYSKQYLATHPFIALSDTASS